MKKRWSISCSRRDLLRRLGGIAAVAAAGYWLVTLLIFSATYFGEGVTISAQKGHLAVYWGEDAELRNSRVINGFEWPNFSGSGAGMSWSLEYWGRWSVSGPADLIPGIPFCCRYPRNFGLYMPNANLWGRTDRTTLRYVGMPAWPIMSVGLMLWIGAKRARGLGRCATCRYELAGLPEGAPCPECGREIGVMIGGDARSRA